MEFAQELPVVNADMCDDINLLEALECDGDTVIVDSVGGDGDSQVVSSPGPVFVGEEGEGVDEVRRLLRGWLVRESSINHLTTSEYCNITEILVLYIVNPTFV